MHVIKDNHGKVTINNESDIIIVRKTVRDVATKLDFGLADMTRIVTAASELARNVFLYAGSGMMKWRLLEVNNTVGIELIFADQGPGIADQEQVMQEGYSTSRGLGLGLTDLISGRILIAAKRGSFM